MRPLLSRKSNLIITSCFLTATSLGLVAQESLKPLAHHPIMRPDFLTLKNWNQQKKQEAVAPDAFVYHAGSNAARLESTAAASTAPPATFSLLSEVPSYKLRNQASCGSCWVWASTGLTEVALNSQYGITDRLSIQYFQSNMSGKNACGGGTLFDFAAWYNNTAPSSMGTNKNPGVLVPWSNPQGAYADGEESTYQATSVVIPGGVGMTPQYSHVTLNPYLLNTYDVTQAQAIANIQAALMNKQAVGFSFYTNFGAADGFDAFWDQNPESTPWINNYEGGTWSAPDSNWGGHMVMIVGWDASDPDPAKQFWIVINQWGTSTGRPNQIFHLPMNLNYGAGLTYIDPTLGAEVMQCYNFETLVLSLPATSTSPAGNPTAVVASLPASPVTMLAGQNLTLAPTLTAGSPPFAYQWSVDLGQGAKIVPGATNETLSLPNDVIPGYGVLDSNWNNAKVTLTVTNSVGAVTTSPVTVNVVGAPLNKDCGFDDGPSTTLWSWLDQTQVDPIYFSTLTNSGSYYARLTGYGLPKGNSGTFTSAPVTLPAPGPQILATYYLDVTTMETLPLALGTCTIQVVDPTGKVLQVLKTHTNMDVDHLTFSPETFDITALNTGTAAAPTQLALQAVWSDPDAATIFRLDDAMILTGGTTGNPTLTSFTPAYGTAGRTKVTLHGTNFTGATGVYFDRTPATTFSVTNATTISATVPFDAFTGPITVKTPNGVITSTGAKFYVAPNFITTTNSFGADFQTDIPDFDPPYQAAGKSITLYGGNFTDATAVTIGGVAATNFQVLNNTMIKATIPSGVASGAVAVVTPGGTATANSEFYTAVAPSITNFLPAAATAGSTITMDGAGLSTITNLTFGGVPVTTYGWIDDNSVLVTLPSGIHTGLVTATNAAGTITSSVPFTVLPPSISGAVPVLNASGASVPFSAGMALTLVGDGLLDVSAVTIAGASIPFQSIDNRHLTLTVPAEAAAGNFPIIVTSPEGISAPTLLTIAQPAPIITGSTAPAFTPTSGISGTLVTVTGEFFTGTTAVTIGGVNAPTFTVIDDAHLTVVVPPTAMTGTITVTNPAGSVTSQAPFTVGLNVLINQAPDNILAGSVYPFTASVSGSATQTVTWSIVEGKAGGKIDASGNYTASGDPGVYHIVATSTVDPTVSATLTVQVNGANLNPATSGTGEVSVVDLAYFINAYGSKLGDANYTALADLNGDGVIDDKDLILFLGAF